LYPSRPTPATYTLSLHDALPISRLQAAQGVEQFLRVARVQSQGRLVENVADAEQTAAEVRRQTGALGFAAGEGRRRAVEREIARSEEHTSELQSLRHLVCRLLLE